jgi:hypothetical protein
MTDNQSAARAYFEAVPAAYLPQPVPTSLVAPMPSDLEAQTPPWWIERLSRKMGERSPRLLRLRSYYRGEQDTFNRLASEAHKLALGRMLFGLKSNLPKLIVLAPAQRLKVQGFRIPVDADAAEPPPATPEAAAEDSNEQNDKEAWRIWQANGLDSRSAVAHAEALAMGECYVLVWSDPKDGKTPVITVEDPTQCIVERDPADSRKRLAAMKRYVDIDGTHVCILYLPDTVQWYRGKGSNPGSTSIGTVTGIASGGKYSRISDTAFQLDGIRWDLDASKTGALPVPGTIPMVPLVNMPRVDGSGESEFESVLPLVDLLNKTLLDLATTAEFTAGPQRWALGLNLDEEAAQTDADGNVVVPAKSPIQQAVNRWITSDAPATEASFGQFPVADLSPYTTIIDAIIKQIGSITFTPYHFLLNMPSAVPATGEALKTAETTLVAKCEWHQVDFGEGWEEVIRVAFLTSGDEKRATSRSETVWKNAVSLSVSQLADALVKLGSLGVPEEQLWHDWGYSPEQIALFPAMRLRSPLPAAPIRITEPVTPADVLGATGDPAAPSPAPTPAKPGGLSAVASKPAAPPPALPRMGPSA